MDGMVEVTKKEFFAVMFELDVHPCSEPHIQYWKLHGQEVIGYTSCGYMWEVDEVEKFFVLPEYCPTLHAPDAAKSAAQISLF